METAAYALKKTPVDSVMPQHLPNIEDRSLLSGQHSRHHLLFAYLTASAAFIFLLVRPSNQYSHLQSGFCLPSSKTSNTCARTSSVSPLPCFLKPCLSQTLLFSCFTASPRKVLPATVPSASLRTENLFVFLLEHESSPTLLSHICGFLLAQNQELKDSFTLSLTTSAPFRFRGRGSLEPICYLEGMGKGFRPSPSAHSSDSSTRLRV